MGKAAKTKQSPQSRGTKPQRQAKVLPQSRATNGPQSRGKKGPQRPPTPEAGKGAEGVSEKDWQACIRFLRKDFAQMMPSSRKKCGTHYPIQLIHVIGSYNSGYPRTGVNCDVNWYIGGNSYVVANNREYGVAALTPGIYLAKTLWLQRQPWWTPGSHEAEISHLRWLGSPREFAAKLLTKHTSFITNTLGERKLRCLLMWLACLVERGGGAWTALWKSYAETKDYHADSAVAALQTIAQRADHCATCFRPLRNYLESTHPQSRSMRTS